jgi:hypothetical protein
MLCVLSASLPSRGGWLILGELAIKGAWGGEAGWRVERDGLGIIFIAYPFAHFLPLFVFGMGP